MLTAVARGRRDEPSPGTGGYPVTTDDRLGRGVLIQSTGERVATSSIVCADLRDQSAGCGTSPALGAR